MKRSESLAYSLYGRALAYSKLDVALLSLFEFVEEAQGDFEIWDRAYVLQQIGDIYFKLQKQGLAKFFYDISLEIDPKSLLGKLAYADFIGRQLDDKAQALKMCDEVIEAARVAPREFFKDNMSKKHYIDEANKLKNEMNYEKN